MKKIALSLMVIAASGAYVWDQAGQDPAGDMLGSAQPANAAETPPPPSSGATSSAPLPAPRPLEPRLARVQPSGETTAAVAAPTPTLESPARQTTIPDAPLPAPRPVAAAVEAPKPFAVTPAVYVPVPWPRPAYPDAPARVLKVGMKLVAQGFADGTYAGPPADAYYGIVQIQAIVQGGRLTALKVLKYPSDRRTSISINRQALPMLRDEAISAQSADVDIISGATLTSRAFVQSLRGALKKASS